MAEVLVIGKKISEMGLVNEITGEEKIPTGVVGDKAVTTGQLLTYLENNGKVQWGRIEGDITNQDDLQNQFTQQLATLQSHIQDQGNPHNVTKDQVGLGSVDNTADMDKPVSTAVQEALANKTHNSLLGRDADGAHPASAVLDGSGVTQQQVNDLTGAPYRVKAGGYGIGERVVLENGGIVQSVVAANTTDPNVDMTGWYNFEWVQDVINDATIQKVASIADLIAIQNPKDGQVVFVESYNPVNYSLPVPYFAKGGGLFKYDSSKSSVNDGGVIIKGWVRQGFSEIDVYMFGAYGNWDATAQTGDDDTIPFQKAVDFLVANGGNIRSSGNRVIKVPVGSFKLSGFTVPQGAAYFSFNLIGEGQFSRLWLNPLGNPINIECENSQFKNMIINGKLTVGESTTNDPSIPYCVVGKLKNKWLDVDILFDGVSFNNYATAVRVSGRGFTFQNGGAGFGNVLCEIALDADLVVGGAAPEIHSLETSLRHFKVHNNRFDVTPTIFHISGSHALKDYINGLTVSDCELTLTNRLVTSDDCTLVSPKFTDNIGIGCFSRNSSGMVTVPSIKDGLDSDNKWFNFIGGTYTLSQTTGIRYLYRCSNIDGLTISGTTAKDLLYGVVQATESADNIKIHKNNFPNFGNTQNNTYVIDTLVAGVKPTNSSIKDNTFTDNGLYTKKWFSADISGSNSLVVKDNSCSNRFPMQSLTYVPKLRINNTDSTTATYEIQTGRYWVEDNYINARVQLNFTDSATSGGVGVSLPVPAISDNASLSSYISGSGSVPVLTNFTVTGGVSISVSASNDQTAKLMISPTTSLSMDSHTEGAITLVCEFKYRFK